MTGPLTSLPLYFDECVDVLVARLLETRGYDCLTALDAGQLNRDDETQLETATNLGRILITHNRVDFERLAIAWWAQGKTHAGIILAVRRADSFELARRILPVLTRYDQVGWRNSTLYA
jgi:predicted nuclease of predicted toxin-antitoxin system